MDFVNRCNVSKRSVVSGRSDGQATRPTGPGLSEFVGRTDGDVRGRAVLRADRASARNPLRHRRRTVRRQRRRRRQQHRLPTNFRGWSVKPCRFI